jgi:uridine kinase
MWDITHIYDIFIHLSTSDDTYINNVMDINEIKRELNPMSIIVSNDLMMSSDVTVNNLLNQNYKIYLLGQHVFSISKAQSTLYDVILKVRPDMYIINKINFNNVTPNTIYIPNDSKIDTNRLTNKTDKYICDMLAYGDCIVMKFYLGLYLKINELITLYGTVNETILYHYLFDNSIAYQEIPIQYGVILSICNTIAISGDSGTGKTTMSSILQNTYENVTLLECDRYHKWKRGDDNWNKFTHLNPEANYITKMNKDVFNLKLGNDIYQVDYDHRTGLFTDEEIVESKPNVIVCGLHSLYLDKHITNMKIYMDTDENLRIYWKIKRDINKRGYTISHIYEQIMKRRNDFITYILPQKQLADIIVNMYSPGFIFNIDSFDEHMILNVSVKIGINTNSYEIESILDIFDTNKTDTHNNFTYIYFPDANDLENIMFKIFKLLKTK